VHAGAVGDAWLGIRPEHIVSGPGVAGAQSQLTTTVELVEPLGSDTMVRVRAEGGHPLWVRVDGQTTIHPGDTLPVAFNANLINLFSQADEARL
jgi:multiple sugar transport system ATP-binding protein